MSNYQLTIITPVFNGAAYIERCLRNVIAQAAPAVEHLVMDGASTDGTPDIVRRLASEHPHIRLVSAPDTGQANAMNKGLALAAAPVVSFLNADDSYAPGTLPRVLALLPDLPSPGFLVGNCRVLDETGRLKEINRPAHLRIDDLLVGSPSMPHPVNPSAYFYHRALHDAAGPYDEHEEYVMDLEFLLRALPAAHVRYVDEVWGNFLMLPGTKTYEDFAHGLGDRRADLARRRALAKLPLPRRFLVQCRRFLQQFAKFRRLPALLAYYARHPAKILWRLRYVVRPAAALAEPAKKGESAGA